MSEPKRVQRQRTKGWRMPEGAVYVGRPTRWGNPFVVKVIPPAWRGAGRIWFIEDENGVDYHPLRNTKRSAVEKSVDLYDQFVTGDWGDITPEEVRAELAGRGLACWCPLDQPCHADVLLEIANPTPNPKPTRADESEEA